MFHPNRTTPFAAARRFCRGCLMASAFLALLLFTAGQVPAEEEFRWGAKLDFVLPTMEEINTMYRTGQLPDWSDGKWDDDQFKKYNIWRFYANLISSMMIANPLWSPDGNSVAFVSLTRTIGLIPSTGGAPRMLWTSESGLTYDNEHNITGGVNDIGKALGFTPDGKEVTFVKNTIDYSRGSVTHTSITDDGYLVSSMSGLVPVIASVNIETGEERTIIDPGLDGRWSHNGRYFVYIRWKQTGGYRTVMFVHNGYFWGNDTGAGIAVRDMETGNEWVLTEGEAQTPCFSPDDAYVLFSMKDTNGIYQIFSVPREGGVLQQMTYYGPNDDGRNALISDVSPDGQWVLHRGEFLADGKTAIGLCAFNTITGKSFLAFPNSWQETIDGSWSPDGKKFAFSVLTPHADPLAMPKHEIFMVDFQPEPFQKATAVSDATPLEFALTGNHPNPFNPSTTITFTLSESGPATLSIYNVTGQKVRELVNGPLSAGANSVVWDGRDMNGQPVSSGIYFSRLTRNGRSVAARMTLMK